MKAILNRLELLSLAKAADSIAPNLAAMDALKGVLSLSKKSALS